MTEGRRENLLASLAFNIAIPGFILSRLSSPDSLGPLAALLVGMSFPLGYGIYDFAARRKWNFFSVVGLLSVGLTGGFALMELDGFWFAVKEASVPAMFGIAVLATLRTGNPLVRTLLLNESVVDLGELDAALIDPARRQEFDRLMRNATWAMAGVFLFSAVTNFVLARVLLKSPGGTPEFVAELGAMTWLSWPVIALPSMLLSVAVVWRLLHGIFVLTSQATGEKT